VPTAKVYGGSVRYASASSINQPVCASDFVLIRSMPALAQDDRRGPRRREHLLVLRVREKRDVAGLGGLNPRDARHLEVAVTLEAALQSLCKIAQFH
jgi:hypothetical protein